MKNTCCIILLLIASSCSPDLRDQNVFGKYIFENLISQRIDRVKEEYLSLKDSNRVLVKNIQMAIFFMEQKKKADEHLRYLKMQDDHIAQWIEVAYSKGFKSEDCSFLRTKLDSCFLRDYKMYTLKVYFSFKGIENYFLIWDVIKLKDGWVFRGINPPTSREEKEKIPYKPDKLFFSSRNWTVNYFDHQILEKFSISLSNATGNDFEYIKFKVTLFDKTKIPFTPIFVKTYERNEKLYNDNMIRFEINELENFNTGIDCNNKDILGFSAEVIDVKPRPEEEYRNW